MFKKLLLTLALTLALALSSAPGFAQSDEAFTAEELAALAKEPPLSQADIDIFIKIAEAPEDKSDKVVAESGLSETRMVLVLTKISLGMMIASNVPSELILTDEVPKVLHPSESELNLIRQNLDKLAD
jgi:hypothetical protein